MNNVDHLEIVQFIEQQILKFKPERIFTHHPNDLNDHVQVSRACLAASRLYQRRSEVPALKALSFMEIPHLQTGATILMVADLCQITTSKSRMRSSLSSKHSHVTKMLCETFLTPEASKP